MDVDLYSNACSASTKPDVMRGCDVDDMVSTSHPHILVDHSYATDKYIPSMGESLLSASPKASLVLARPLVVLAICLLMLLVINITVQSS
jgi:hypothetical protein